MVVTNESQPDWFVKVTGRTVPTSAGLQLVLFMVIASEGSNVVVVVTRESHPSWLVCVSMSMPAKDGSHVV